MHLVSIPSICVILLVKSYAEATIQKKVMNGFKRFAGTYRDPETFNNLVIFTTDPNVSNHCDNMMEMVESLEDYLTIKVERVNVWRSQMNFKLFEKFDRRECNGLPLLVNRKTGARICGISTKQNLLNWATGKKTEFMPEMYPDDMDSPNEDDAPF